MTYIIVYKYCGRIHSMKCTGVDDENHAKVAFRSKFPFIKKYRILTEEQANSLSNK